MKANFRAAVAPIFLSITCAIPAYSIACELHENGFLQNSFSKSFHLPAVGTKATVVTHLYGEPIRRLNGPGGLDIWDYGSFKVMVKDTVVTFAGMW